MSAHLEGGCKLGGPEGHDHPQEPVGARHFEDVHREVRGGDQEQRGAPVPPFRDPRPPLVPQVAQEIVVGALVLVGLGLKAHHVVVCDGVHVARQGVEVGAGGAVD